MKITPQIEIVKEITIEKEQKEHFTFPKEGKVRGNNRKQTRSRKTQVIWYQDGSVFPPVLRKKIIKHL
jgi:hypothetical protein